MSLRRPTVANLLFIFLISPLWGVTQTPDCGMPVIYFRYKPFMWRRLDARLRHALFYYPFEASLQTPDRCILFLFPDCLSMFYMNNLPVCVMNFISWQTKWSWNISEHGYHLLYYTCVHNVCEYIQSTHWLVPGYCLGEISCLERSAAMTAPEPRLWWQQPREDRSYPGQLFLWEMESHRRWWTANRFRHQPLETICYTHWPEWSCTTYFVFRLEFLYQVGVSSANSNPGAGEHKDHLLGN